MYPGKSATASEDGFVATLDDGAMTPIGAAFVKPENLADTFGGATFQTESGDVALQPFGSTVSLPSGNALKATLSASTSTGLFSGKFLYAPEGGATPYTVSYKGVFVPALGIGAGYHIAPDTSLPGYTVKRSKPVVIAP